jgi:site-specific DNA recombinase
VWFQNVCPAKLVNKDRLETLVIDRVKANILTEENLTSLVKLTNEEIRQSKDKNREKLSAIDGQLERLRHRLNKLYDALETGKLEMEDLAPRIKEQKTQVDELERKRIDLTESIRDAKVELLDASVVKAYVYDLKTLLSKGSILEQRSFLRSFIKRVEVNLPKVAIDYTIPLETKKVEPLTREVLPIAQSGSRGWTRTSDRVVNSHLLYRLSYAGVCTINFRINIRKIQSLSTILNSFFVCGVSAYRGC